MVKENDLLGSIDRQTLPDGLKFVGSKACSLCHKKQYEKNSKMRHAHAYQTLVDAGSEYDPECIVCHVVGLGYESGFKSENSPVALRNVGCENCHGPGSAHLEAEEDSEKLETMQKPDPKKACIKCHVPDHSPKFEAETEEYFKKIIHW
jgi:hypothetical protein